MASNKDYILAQYADGAREDGRAILSRTSALEFHYTKKHLANLISKDTSVLEIGCATGHYGVYYADKCQAYLGVDLTPAHIALFKHKIAEMQLQNVSCQLGDATDLSGIPDGSFDVVLCLGPMYHLPLAEREMAFQETARVCKKGGVAAFAYINRIGVYAGACVMDGVHYPSKLANQRVLIDGTDDIRPDTFFYTIPEEMERSAARHGLCKIKNLATDFFITMNVVDSMTDEQFELMRPLYDQMTSHESCTGMSNHALLVCKKESF